MLFVCFSLLHQALWRTRPLAATPGERHHRRNFPLYIATSPPPHPARYRVTRRSWLQHATWRYLICPEERRVSLFIDSLQRLQRLRQQHRSWSVRRRRSICGYRKYRTKLRTWTLRLVRQLFRSAFSAHFTYWPLTRRLPSNLYTIHLEHLAFGLREFGLTGDLPWLSTTSGAMCLCSQICIGHQLERAATARRTKCTMRSSNSEAIALRTFSGQLLRSEYSDLRPCTRS
jgi:hypothetical protein